MLFVPETAAASSSGFVVELEDEEDRTFFEEFHKNKVPETVEATARTDS